ncbi:SDR family oxidoreductase [Stenotrophomonas maltophilia]|uniref:SDR family oxidoreductase n=1 Tax=Stenotrophomonas maltophilia TaxID=40324 RepID=UPI00130F7BF0|nr:SDR family oxidoreductase [Stenotrophomonas maltophilia]UXL28954.1 SDR family oxidoreductase [Stenotrophomonas maltophilia]
MTLANKTLAIIGGSSGIGLRAACQAAAQGAQVVIGGRDPQRLQQALLQVGQDARAIPVDGTSRDSLQAFFAGIGTIDALFTPGASYQVGSFAGDGAALAYSPFNGKFWPQYWAVHAALPYLTAEASIVLVAGAAGARPVNGAAAYAACNSAIEGLGRALATELAPRRVNVISPGTLDGELWQGRPAALREAAFAHYADVTLLRRVATVEDAADAALFLLGNPAMTGSTLFPDNGYVLR